MYNSVDDKRAQSEEEHCENERHYFVRDCSIAPLASPAGEAERQGGAELSLSRAVCARLRTLEGQQRGHCLIGFAQTSASAFHERVTCYYYPATPEYRPFPKDVTHNSDALKGF